MRTILSLASTLTENATETENRIRKSVFPFQPNRTTTEYRDENVQVFLFQLVFSVCDRKKDSCKFRQTETKTWSREVIWSVLLWKLPSIISYTTKLERI